MKDNRKEIRNRHQRRKPSSRIFSWTRDRAAFIDRICLSVRGSLGTNFTDNILDPQNRATLHPTSIYSRVVRGKCPVTENRIEIRYGRAKHFENIPPVQIVMHSEKVPVTGAHALRLLKGLCTDAPDVSVSLVELTFDFTRIRTAFLLRHLVHKAKGDVRILTDGKRTTLYVGSPRSAWQVRIYRKQSSVLRLEFILRRPFLARHGLLQVEDLVLLRCFPLWDLLSFRRFSKSSAVRATEHKSAFVKKLIVTWGATRPTVQRLPTILKRFGIDAQVLRPTDLQRRLHAMQRHLIW